MKSLLKWFQEQGCCNRGKKTFWSLWYTVQIDVCVYPIFHSCCRVKPALLLRGTTTLDVTYTSSTKTPRLHYFNMLLIIINQGVTLVEAPSHSDPTVYVFKVELAGFHHDTMSSEDHAQSWMEQINASQPQIVNFWMLLGKVYWPLWT